MLNAIIIDDEETSVAMLKEHLSALATEVNVVGEAYNVEQGLALLRRTSCDVLFLDIEMPDGTGFDLLDQHNEIDFEVVFITAFNQYAIKAFRYAALDYLMKPINPEILDETVSRIKREDVAHSLGRVNVLLENMKGDAEFKKLAISTTEGVYYYNINELIRCEADGSYTTIYAQDQKPIVASKSIKEYESILPNNFGRVHKSHLVNFQFVKQFVSGDQPHLLLKDESSVAVSRRRKQLVAEMLSNIG